MHSSLLEALTIQWNIPGNAVTRRSGHTAGTVHMVSRLFHPHTHAANRFAPLPDWVVCKKASQSVPHKIEQSKSKMLANVGECKRGLREKYYSREEYYWKNTI